MKRNWIIFGAALIVFLIVVLVNIRHYYSSRARFLSLFQRNQILHVKHISDEIESFFAIHSHLLQALPSRPSPISRHTESDIRTYFEQYQRPYIKAISLYDDAGKTLYSTDPKATSSNVGQDEFFSWAREKGNMGKVFVSRAASSQARRAEDSWSFFVAIPLYQDSSGTGPARFVGALSSTIDLKAFFSDELRDPETKLRQAWIIDSHGNVLLHSEHPEMVSRNVSDRNESCSQCHLSFDYVDTILKRKQGVVDYLLRNSTKKMAAFAPIEFPNTSWILVINDSYDEVAAFGRQGLHQRLLLLGIFALTFIVGSIFVTRNNRLKVKAEEESKSWQKIIAERRETEKALLEREERFRTLVETMNDGLAIENENAQLAYVNHAFCEMLGYKQENLIGRSMKEFIDEEDGPMTDGGGVKPNGDGTQTSELALKGNGGRRVHALVSSKPILNTEGQMRESFTLVTDITKRRRAEQDLRNLSSQLLTAQETERRRISKELHDELGGALALLRIEFALMEKNLNEDQTELREKCRQNLQYLGQVADNVYRLSHNLSPGLLEDLGLTAALRWLVDHFGKHFNVEVSSNVPELNGFISREAEIMVYRIIQEALANIGKHARAGRVSVAITTLEDRIRFVIEDDGKGFNAEEVYRKDARERGMGLMTMGERVRMLGGLYDLVSQEGQGTRISFAIPRKT
jgi:PAS domain S-box-containing protein